MAVGWGDLSAWLAETHTEDVLVALVRVGALALACWLLASTFVYLGASALRLPRLVRSVEWATLPSVRRLVDGAVAGSLVAAALGVTSPAHASDTTVPNNAYVPHPAGDGPAPAPVPFETTTTGVAAPTTTVAPATNTPTVVTTTTAATRHQAPIAPTTASVAASPTAPPRPASPAPTATYVVRAGDSLWRIATQLVAARSGDLDDIAPYWLRLVEANRARLVSGDPDLIYPGEVLVLPDVVER